MDWEAELAGPILDIDGVTARYESAVDGEPDGQVVLDPITVLYKRGYVGINALGVAIDDHETTVMGRRSELWDARRGGIVHVNGAKYVVSRAPQDDGRVWIKLMLEGPIG